tara:strand:+ start:353 stop:601 length:249 start_codon:yes stop_codon:yes gene_type:complete
MYICKGKKMRAESIPHVEYEILSEVINNIDIADVQDAMVTDVVTEKRFKTGAKNVAKLLRNLMARRTHRLPHTHTEYKQKEE